tara:strand:+ start:102 stop:827 length:726 start_codon:yes stop_codon:yes gene_type:complete
MALPLVMAGLSIGGSLLKGHMASRSAVKNFARQHGAAVYSSHFNKLRIDQRNLDTQRIFSKKLEQTKEQLSYNAQAANQAYQNEDLILNNKFAQASWAREEMMRTLDKVHGKQAASSQGVGSSRSRDRANLINSIGNFGVQQAKLTASLASERAASKLRKAGIGRQHLQSDFQAWAQTAIAPRLEWAAPEARMGSTSHLQGSPLQLATAAMGGATTYFESGGTAKVGGKEYSMKNPGGVEY